MLTHLTPNKNNFRQADRNDHVFSDLLGCAYQYYGMEYRVSLVQAGLQSSLKTFIKFKHLDSKNPFTE